MTKVEGRDTAVVFERLQHRESIRRQHREPDAEETRNIWRRTALAVSKRPAQKRPVAYNDPSGNTVYFDGGAADVKRPKLVLDMRDCDRSPQRGMPGEARGVAHTRVWC